MTEQVEAPAEAEAPAEGQAAPEPQQHAEVETKAKRLGWTPKEEFKGDPAKWVDAETFVKRGEEVLPIVQANNRRLEKALEIARREISELKDTFKEFGEYHSKTVKATYETARRDLEARLEQAAEVGDVEGVKKATREISDLEKDMREPPKAKEEPANKVDPAFQEAFDEWHEENAWFQKDRAMTVFALDLDEELAAKGMSPAKRFAEITKQVKAEFPHKFTNPRRDGHSAVEGGSQPNGRKAAKGWDDLPTEAKRQADRFIAAGILKDRAAFLKDYAW